MKWFYFVIILLPLMVFAQTTDVAEKPLLVIKPYSKNFITNEIEKNQIDKIILKACTRQQSYQIALGELGAAKKSKYQIHYVQVELTENGPDDFGIKAILLDEKKKKLVNKIVETGIQRMVLLRKIEEVMEQLFLPVEKTTERNEAGKKKSEIVSL